jgi:sterol desaturase/sphingolipid hydroxylase (fatty acid hydroxylase superfamily)
MDLAAHLKSIGNEGVELAVMAAWFFALAWVVKRGRALADARAAAGETRINLTISIIDMLAVAPLVGWVTGTLANLLQQSGLIAPSAGLWAALGPVGTGLVAIFLGDFAGYWRHRLQHTPWLWPAHAVHHSDTRLTWFSLGRMHPIDRLGTILDILVLAALGVPVWAVSLAVLIRHYYGHFIHADLPWSLGPLGWIINPPIAHRWHHARDVTGSGANFATVFSVFDRAFGTWYAPGPCEAPLGVREAMGRGALGQYLHPFRTWGAAIAAQIRSRSQATSGASAGGMG